MKLTMGFGLSLMTAIVAIFSTADCTWSSQTIYASTSTNSQQVTASAYDHYEFKIQSSTWSSSSYYLEISWSSRNYDITGNMPYCKEAYMEIFITSGHKSIGRFCSNNAGAPFQMYSSDGYAKIVVSANGNETRAAVTFYYQLKSKSSYPLGSSTSSSACYNTYNYGRSGIIYSTGWPYNYKSSSSSCNYHIQKSYGYQGIYVVFMDINLYSSWYSYSRDCVQVYGSNYSFYYNETAISSSLCGTANIEAYNTYSKYLKITFDRRSKPSYSSYRGFVAGYIMFRTPMTKPVLTASFPTAKPAKSSVSLSDPSSSSIIFMFLIALLIVIITIIVIGIAFCITKCHRCTARDADHAQPQNSSTVSTTQHTTSQPTLQTVTPPAYANLAFSQPQQFYPTTSMQTAMYPMGTDHVAYPTTQSYSTSQFTSAEDAPPQYSSVVDQTQSCIPTGALQPARASVVQAQEPTGALNPVPSSSSNSGGNAPLPITSVQMPYNVPPPAYCDVPKS